jgi:hypothetical protein
MPSALTRLLAYIDTKYLPQHERELLEEVRNTPNLEAWVERALRAEALERALRETQGELLEVLEWQTRGNKALRMEIDAWRANDVLRARRLAQCG